jgi:hypothetical protein
LLSAFEGEGKLARALSCSSSPGGRRSGGGGFYVFQPSSLRTLEEGFEDAFLAVEYLSLAIGKAGMNDSAWDIIWGFQNLQFVIE